MRVAFDISPLTRSYPPGVTRATRGLFEALEESDALELVPLSPAADESERSWRHRRLPRLLGELDCVGLHSPVSAFPHAGPGRRLQTVHELPWRHGAAENADLSHRFWASFGPWRADAVICPTDFVRRDLLAESTHGHGRIHVAPWGIAADFAVEVEGDARRRLLERLGLPVAPFLLALGAVRAKKNLAASLRALAADPSPEVARLQLVVTGEGGDDLRRDLELADHLGVRDRVHAPGRIEEHELPLLLGAAQALVLLSTSEGFGFPALEALACGTPAIVARDSAPAEVVGNLGLRVDPADPLDVAAAFRRTLTPDEHEREGLRQRAAEFSWERCARRVEEIWTSWAP